MTQEQGIGNVKELFKSKVKYSNYLIWSVASYFGHVLKYRKLFLHKVTSSFSNTFK
jgi:hypothetical protein